jgi:hypothetical protein
LSSPEYEFTAFGTKIDNEHLLTLEPGSLLAPVVEPLGARRIAHRHGNFILSRRYYKTPAGRGKVRRPQYRSAANLPG